MKKFDKDQKCPKCGWDMINSVFIPGTANNEYIEKIRRTCTMCGFSWNNHPLDHEEK